MASTIVACLALSAGGKHLAVYPSRILVFTRTPQAGAEDLAQYENTKAGTEPDWIPEDVLAETWTQVCAERSVLVLTAAEYRKELEKPLPGSGGPKLPTMILPSEQNPGEYEEHFVFQD